MAEESWDAQLQEYMIDTELCYAAGLAQSEDGAFYAAAPTADEAGWGIIFKEDHEEEILQEDGETVKKVTINEGATLKHTIDKMKAPPEGLWLGGQKYRITRTDEKEEVGDTTIKWVQGNYPKNGVHIMQTNSQIIVGFYNEEKGFTSGNCKKSTAEFAAYLLSIGY
mmetsp:Transcript_74705/g.139455  ORF Transcript_74705/g.139455 Transcript_74705/m.139455 type:complete len:167 (+) Transcript_74705:105-605(+)